MRRYSTVMLLMLIFMTGTMAPARATDGFGVSSDGINWGRTVTEPLVPSQMLWVPGDEISGTFYIRNRHDEPASLTVEVISADTGSLMDTGDLHISAIGTENEWNTISRPGTHEIVSSPKLAPGVVTPVQVNVSFAAASGNISQLRSAKLHFRVTLADTAPTDSDNDRPGGWLPETGIQNSIWYALLAAILISIGLPLLIWRKKMEENPHD